jgi:replicative DNA helicase
MSTTNSKSSTRSSLDLLDGPPPHDVDAEKGVLGALLVDLSRLEDVAFLAPEDFHNPDYGKLFDHLRQFPHNGEGPADTTLLLSWLKGQKEVDRLGPLIGELFDKHPLACRAAHYARIVKGHADKRKLILLGADLVRAGYNGDENPAALAAEYVARLENIGHGEAAERFPVLSMAELNGADFSAD